MQPPDFDKNVSSELLPILSVIRERETAPQRSTCPTASAQVTPPPSPRLCSRQLNNVLFTYNEYWLNISDYHLSLLTTNLSKFCRFCGHLLPFNRTFSFENREVFGFVLLRCVIGLKILASLFHPIRTLSSMCFPTATCNYLEF